MPRLLPLVIAPTALGLLAPLALDARRSAYAADPTLAGISAYTDSRDQVTAISQFSDLRPSDWAYQALSNLIERYACIAGYPSGTMRAGQAISRYEAAALLNACLDRISEVTDDLRRLLKDFERERVILKGRTEDLEHAVGVLAATQFSTTTKLTGLATFVVGANGFSGSADARLNNSRSLHGATTFSYDLNLTFDTSFTGKDLLRTNLRGGNFAESSFGGDGPSLLSQLEVAFQQDLGSPGADGGDVIALDRLYYQFPVGDFTVTIGGKVGQEDMLAIWPSVYPAETVLDVLTLGGAPAAYNKNLGTGAGVWWQKDGFGLSANYVALHGDHGDSANGGIATAGSGSSGTLQIGYSSEQWGIAAIYTAIQNANDVIVYGTNFTLESFSNPGNTAAYGLSAYWQPATSGWMPSISAGWGLNTTSYSDDRHDTDLVSTSQSWSVGLQWQDAFLKGNVLGMGVGQAPFATRLENGETPDDTNLIWEWWYKVQLTDMISVTPALFVLNRPLGAETPEGQSFNQLGGLIKTSFRF